MKDYQYTGKKGAYWVKFDKIGSFAGIAGIYFLATVDAKAFARAVACSRGRS